MFHPPRTELRALGGSVRRQYRDGRDATRALAEAVAAGELGTEADSDEAVYLISTLIVGVSSQAMANEPDLEWGRGRFSPLFPKLMRLLVAAYPPVKTDP